jgi:hypothetical protein
LLFKQPPFEPADEGESGGSAPDAVAKTVYFPDDTWSGFELAQGANTAALFSKTVSINLSLWLWSSSDRIVVSDVFEVPMTSLYQQITALGYRLLFLTTKIPKTSLGAEHGPTIVYPAAFFKTEVQDEHLCKDEVLKSVQ